MEWQSPVEVGPGLGFQVRVDEQGRCWWRLVIHTFGENYIESEERVLATDVLTAFVGDVPFVNSFGIYITFSDGSAVIPARIANGGVYFQSIVREE